MKDMPWKLPSRALTTGIRNVIIKHYKVITPVHEAGRRAVLSGTALVYFKGRR